MSATRMSLACVTAILLGACAIHPAPENVTGLTTYQIARQIRCETREAAKNRVLEEFRTLAVGSPYEKPNPVAIGLLARYDNDREDISSFRPAMFTGADNAEIRNYLTTIYGTAVAYSFDLTMDETNNLNMNLDFLGPWFNKFTLNVTGDANRDRLNEELFTLTDTLAGLLMDRSTQHGVPYCGAEQLAQPNYIYPIAGQIGVVKTVKNFLDLNTFTTLAASDGSKSGSAAQTAPTYTEKLIFTTTIDLSANPKITFTPGGNAFQFTDASLTGLARRTDTHKVYIALALQPSAAAALAALHSYLSRPSALSTFSRTSSSGRLGSLPLYIGNSITAHANTPGENLALISLDQMRSREVQLVPTR